MTHSRAVPARWEPLALIVVAAVLTALVAIPASAEAAAPRCFGKVATIVGTAGDDVLEGTTRNDVIVGKGGDDIILGGGGVDRICAGGGADVVSGGAGGDLINAGYGNDTVTGKVGNDRLVGGAGDDVIRGGGGDDIIKGGGGTDRCYQGAGSGVIATCETADLAVVVSSPRNSSVADVDFTVTITNYGPDAASFVLDLSQSADKATCDPAIPAWAGGFAGPIVPPGGNWSDTFTASCTKDANGARVQVDAAVSTNAIDPDPLNDTGFSRTNLR